MTREQGNEAKQILIDRVEAGNFDNKTMELLRTFCRNIKAVHTLGELNRAMRVYATPYAALQIIRQEQERTQAHIMENIKKWVLVKDEEARI